MSYRTPTLVVAAFTGVTVLGGLVISAANADEQPTESNNPFFDSGITFALRKDCLAFDGRGIDNGSIVAFKCARNDGEVFFRLFVKKA
ncbi:hypothetical protein FKR81_37210 [Lentzea tibetensis]|uniref:Uncharacterized protein n=1 Tax=Lentzea tibetensis TaxID=2591470 RepID=A0A563EHC7_9PSEU|nr:hypothetical protein [Lentzea tibetensis]TWP46024.1 hypothetical protein FKR81_37210 [Lentzea tibetensis]